MSEPSPPTALDRIDRALARIEVAAALRDTSRARLIARHAALRSRMAEAIAALDAVLEREQN
ncbi:hypothetical protein [Sphingomonas psychrolutea]|uniref:Uncharacterized protein n=1 Tax=Sphingomonas psychrolutea TaxID=1259676 RepID=A0ABQ1GTU0_9SPHN|nr:hypothetical protein [Sphingomonas psychrolutea]GGA49963.1 hypothetical protein GCM10011395_20360 [Sphingomonas psychrolutea]